MTTICPICLPVSGPLLRPESPLGAHPVYLAEVGFGGSWDGANVPFQPAIRPGKVDKVDTHPVGQNGGSSQGSDPLAHHQRRHPTGRFFREGRQAVGVGIKGNADVGVPQSFAYDLGMNPGAKSQGGMGVPEVMKPNLRHSGFLGCPLE